MGRPRNYDRDEILNAAAKTFWRLGYLATTIANLVEATGVDKKVLFREFGSKEKLFAEALSLYVENSKRHIVETLTPLPLGLDNIRRYMSSMTVWASRPNCLLSKVMNELEVVTEQHRSIVREALTFLERHLALNVSAGVKSGELLSTTDVNTKAKYIVYAIYGINTVGHFEKTKKTILDVSEMIVDGISTVGD